MTVEPAVGADRQQPVAAGRPEIRHASDADQPPSIAFLRSACTGLSPSQILVSARLNASPGIAPFAAPLKPTAVRVVDEIERDDVAFLHLAERPS